MLAYIGRLLRLPFEVVLTVVVLLDDAARPLYRPLLRWLATLQIVGRFERWIAARHRFTILLLLLIPMAVVEPIKILALFWMARGALLVGGITLAVAYLAGFVLVERIHNAGRNKLMTIGWYSWLMRLIGGVRATMLAWARQTAIWEFAERTRDAVRSWMAPQR